MKALAATAALLVANASLAQNCPTRASWPTSGFPSKVSEVATAKATEIRALEDYAFTLVGTDEERKGIRTDAVVIVHAGQLVYEKYARGYGEAKKHLTWSVTKSFTNALTGIAVGNGLVKLSDSICAHRALPETSCAVTIQNLLEFGSGFDWNEGYEGTGNQQSSVLAMLYGEGRTDMARFVAGHPFRDPPGESYAYSSGDTTLLAGVIGVGLEKKFGRDFPRTQLFGPLGMTSATLERDGVGTLVGSSYLYATPRDLAKFGYFLLSDGCWERGGSSPRAGSPTRRRSPSRSRRSRSTPTPETSTAASSGSTSRCPSRTSRCRSPTCPPTCSPRAATGGSRSPSSPRSTW